MKKWDVLGIGTITVDNLLFVDQFPRADSKLQVQRTERHGGGLVATALVTTARLGVQSAFAGIMGYDSDSQWAENDLQAEGVDISTIKHRDDARIITAYIIVDEVNSSRTILFRKDSIPTTRDDYPSPETLQSAEILLIDDVISPNIVQIAREARSVGIEVVADFENHTALAMEKSINHLIVPAAYALRATEQPDIESAIRILWHEGRDLVAVTDGENGCWYYTGSGAVIHQPAFTVEVVDTTGCGDVFHGAYCATLRWGWDVDKRIEFASATAAMKTQHAGGRFGIPTRDQVEQFLDHYS